jgi:hypothetical protein
MLLFLSTAATLPTDRKQTPRLAFRSAPVHLLASFLLLLPLLSRAGPLPQENEKEPLGSLTTFGEVYVNDLLAPAETTIFPGDRVRTAESGLATFNMSGKSSLKLSPHTEVIFSGKYEYTAELGAGSVILNSVPGIGVFTLRIGSDVVVPSSKEQTALAEIDKAPNGSFLVKCSDGALGVLALQGSQGRFLQTGQSMDVSPTGALAFIQKQDTFNSKSDSSKGRTIGITHSYPPWAYLGAAGAVAGIAAALSMSHGGGKQSISPAVP